MTVPKQGELLVGPIFEKGPIMPTHFHYGDDSEIITNRLEQKIHLLNTLEYLSLARQAEGMSVAADANKTKQSLRAQATETFRMATGYYALRSAEVEGEWHTKGKLWRIHEEMWTAFIDKYDQRNNPQARNEFRDQLRNEISNLTDDPEQSISLYNRSHGLRPHNSVESEKDVTADESEQLSRSRRLEAIAQDPRARFLPKNSKALVRVMTWLDYLDNPEAELGIGNQLRDEVMIRAQNPTRKSDKPDKYLGARHGIRALESITWELGDDYLDSVQRFGSLSKVASVLQEGYRPDLSLYEVLRNQADNAGEASFREEFGEYAHGLAALVQYMDLQEYMKGAGHVHGILTSPLKTTENPPRRERPKEDATPGKRKTIASQYTRPDLTPEFEIHIYRKLEAVTVKEARAKIKACLQDLHHEQEFYARRLEDIDDLNIVLDAPIKRAVEQIRLQIADIITEDV